MPGHGRLLWGVLGAALVWPAAAGAAETAHWSVTRAGDPHLWIRGAAVDVVWRECRPGEPCREVGRESVVGLGETAAGTVFEADLTDENGTVTHRSPAWRGRVAPSAAPGLQGELRSGGTVTVTPGQWSGGWGDEHSSYNAIACPAVGGPDCVFLDPVVPHTYWKPGPYTLDDTHAGWYVYVTEGRAPRDYGPAIPVYAAPVGKTRLIITPSAMGAIGGPYGPVAARAPTPVVTPSPTASIRSRAYRRKGRLVVGRVDCATRCQVRVTVRGGGRKLRRSLRVTGARTLTIPHRSGRLHVRVVVDGKRVASGWTVAR